MTYVYCFRGWSGLTKHYANIYPKYIADEIIKKRNIQLKDED
nr:hypothetical protein [Mycoplasmopsis bovis]